MYHGSQKHAADLDAVLERAWQQGVERIIITGTSLEESTQALALARRHPRLYATVGCHPTRSTEFAAGGAAYRAALLALVAEGAGKVVAFGETGLDWDRLHFSPREAQLEYFAAQLAMAAEARLPLFLHERAADADFVRLLREHRALLAHGGVVHSYTGSLATARTYIDEFGLCDEVVPPAPCPLIMFFRWQLHWDQRVQPQDGGEPRRRAGAAS